MKGNLSLTIAESEIGPGLFHTDKERRVDQAITLPMVRLDELSGEIKFGKKRMTLKDFQFVGPDLEGKLSGFITMDEDKTKRRLKVPVEFKFDDKFKRKPPQVVLGLKNCATDRKSSPTRAPWPLEKWQIKGKRQEKTSRCPDLKCPQEYERKESVEA